jgi:quercetin dioxygenase-like cupin family protein
MIPRSSNLYAQNNIVLPDVISEDERLWVPTADKVWIRPLFLSVSQGYWITATRIRRSGIISKHSHTQAVHCHVLKGSWRYLEHDWVANEGSYVYEPPGGTHTLVVDEGVGEMITTFQVHGSMVYLDKDDSLQGYDDVFTRVEQCRRHFEAVGLGASYVENFIR